MDDIRKNAICVRISNRMKRELSIILKRPSKSFSNKPTRIFKQYIKFKKIDVKYQSSEDMKNIMVKWFFDTNNAFYLCGNQDTLNKIIPTNDVIKKPKPTKTINEFKKKEVLSHKEKYRRYLKSAKWKNFKKGLIKTRGHKCEKCGEKYRPLDGHHVTYKRLFNELPEDVLLLCHQCHKLEHPDKTHENPKRITLTTPAS